MHETPVRGGRTAFVGRESEMAALDAALARAARFKAPQTVTIVGALGLGKTRLCDEWLASKASAGFRVVRAAAPTSDLFDGSEGASQPPRPRALLAALLRHRFQLDGAPDGTAALTWFRAELQRVFGDRRVAEVASLLGGFLGFEMPESPLSQALIGKPEQGADLARAVLCRFLEQDALVQPLVLMAEDLHQADEESLDLLAELSAELGEAPILIVATARPDLLVRRPSWGRTDGSHVRLDLGPLTRPALDAMIRSTLGTDELAPGLLDRALVESAGSPFLLEQLLRVYRQHGILVAETGQEGVDWWFDHQRAERERMAVTREEAAHMRVAALTPSERDVLSRGAIFGSVFWTGGVVALGRLGGVPADEAAVFAPDAAIAEIRQILENLEERDYLVRLPDSVLPGETAWGFKHALEQPLIEAGVDPALSRRRRLFAAQWLESRGGEAREQRLEALAHLYEGAGDARRAAYCFITAAGHAQARSLLDRAHLLYLAAIRLLDLDDAVAKMDALYAAGDIATRLGRTREALGHFGEMLRLAWRLDLPAKGGAAHGRIGRLHGTLGAHRRALAHLELARQLFDVAGDAPGIAAALDDVGRIHFLTGAPEASLACHRAALAVRERLGDDRGRALALARMGQVEHEAGDLGAAGEHFRQALELRRRVGDRQGVVASLLDLGGLELDLGHVEQAIYWLEEGRSLAREHGERLFESSLAIEIGECHLANGKPRLACQEYEAARDIARQFGARVLVSEATRGIAEAELALGDPRRARDDARTAFEIAERIGAAPLVGAALRVVAASVGQGAPGEADLGGAREMFDRAVEVLSNAGAELELARTLAAYAEFETRVGRGDTAVELRRQADLIRDRSRQGGRLRRPTLVEGEPEAGGLQATSSLPS
jgi:tetratricopeptide (TPR) repeat protein